VITNRFSKNAPVSMAQGRHGELIVVQGNGVRPARWTGVDAAVDAGMDAPTSALAVAYSKPSGTDAGPVYYENVKLDRVIAGYAPPGPTLPALAAGGVTVDMTPQYYVARVDITKPGACYYAPPEATFSTDSPPSPPSGRVVNAASYLSQSSVSEIRVLDGGKGYGAPPTVVLSDSHGKDAAITAILDVPDTGPVDPDNNPQTGISQWDITETPPTDSPARFAGLEGVNLDLPINGNGTFTVPAGTSFIRVDGGSPIVGCNPAVLPKWTTSVTYKIAGWRAGRGAVLRIRWTGSQWLSTRGGFENCSFWAGATQPRDATVRRFGANYADAATITVTIQAIDGDLAQKVVFQGYTSGNPNNTDAPRYPLRSLSLTSGGSGFLVAPLLKIVSDSGFGAYGTCKVANGKIVEVTLENSGGGYKTAPKVEIVSGGAEAFAVSRPHLRGTYQCYYRFVDGTPEDAGGPIPSNLSPVTEIDTGEGAARLTWNPPAPTGRAKKVELWRTTGDQAVTLYRVATVTETFLDDLTDEELRNADRAGYAAMPIVLPNGELNANRFGVPPSDKAVVVRFQDRHWYGVDTGGKQPNTILYSEVDEPESVPDTNEIVLQQNARDSDSLRAMIPFGSTLLLMQERHAFSLTFAKTPLLDAQVTPIAFRGCISQRCWDIYDGVCYVADQYGVYAIQPTGQIESLSDAIADQFRERIDFAKSTWSFLLVEPKSKILRFFAAFKDDSSGGSPSRALCYSIDMKSWWFEKYPQRISGGTQVRLSNGDFRCAYAADSGPVLLGEGMADIGRGAVTKVTLTNAGSGYRTPPKVTASGGCGAEFQASIDGRGKVTAIWIVSPGYGYTSGPLVISPPDDPNTASPVRAVATYEATSKTADTPLFTSYRYKSGAVEYVTDADDPKAASGMSRSIGLSYQPQSRRSLISLRAYYNNSTFPRGNVALRNRGTGFVHDTVDNAARHDMQATQTATGYETGVAKAMFSGRSIDDIRSSDRHIAVELVGARTAPDPVTIYEISLDGVAGK